MHQQLWGDDYLEPKLVTDCNDDDADDDGGVGYFFWRAKEKLASIARAFREGESIPVPVVAPGGEEKEAKEEREGRRDFAEQMRMGRDSGRRPDQST